MLVFVAAITLAKLCFFGNRLLQAEGVWLLLCQCTLQLYHYTHACIRGTLKRFWHLNFLVSMV